MASGLAEIRRGPGIKDSQISPTAGIRRHKLSLGDRYFYDNFKGRPLCAKADGAGAATGTAADTNILFTGKNLFEYFIIGTQTIVAPVIGTGGLAIGLDSGATGSEGAEYSLGITAQSPAAFTVGTDAFYMKVKLSVSVNAGVTSLYTGFRLAEAAQAAVASYNTYGCIGILGSDIKIASELDGNANGVVDTTDNYTAASDVTFSVFVDLGGNFTYEIDGVPPTVTEPIQATAGDVMVPFIHFVDAASATVVTLKEFECGLVDANVR
jgi:hypothetical protein